MVAEQSKANGDARLNVWQTFVLGVKVLGGELYWNVLKLLRRFEIRELEKRLAREYETLGRLQAGKIEGDEGVLQEEKELCLKQVAFLEKEIAFLKDELLGLRDSIVEHRREKWNI
ncbi:MAG: hypothetical protein K9K64_05845 [Desulfohalobiaceae bacterium]|nr:hypothetical protein [Desulfohalobiaceae bacterium]